MLKILFFYSIGLFLSAVMINNLLITKKKDYTVNVIPVINGENLHVKRTTN